MRGYVHHGRREIDKAIRDYDEAVRLDPTLAEARAYRGDACATLGELDKAIADFSEAIRLKPNSENLLLNRGVVWQTKGDFEDAIKDYTEAIRINPRSWKAYYDRGLTRRIKGDLDGAIADFTEEIRLNPNLSDAFNARGAARGLKGDYGHALSDLDEALRLNPKNDGALVNRANIRATCPESKYRDGAKAVTDAMEACDLSRWSDPIYIGALAAGYAEVGQFTEAIRYLKIALALPGCERRYGAAFREQMKQYEQRKPFRAPKP